MIDLCHLCPLILENLGSGLIVLSEERTIVYANKKDCELLKKQKKGPYRKQRKKHPFCSFFLG